MTIYRAQWLLVLTLYVNEYLWYYCNYENKKPHLKKPYLNWALKQFVFEILLF